MNEFLNIENAYTQFNRETAKRPKYVGLLYNHFEHWYEILFEPPQSIGYSVVKLHGTI